MFFQTGLQGLTLAVFLLALGAASWHSSQGARTPEPPLKSSAGPLSSASESGESRAWQTSEMLPGIGKRPGSPSLATLPNGQLAAVWTAVSRSEEIGRPEQATIWFSLRTANGWQEPVPVATREDAAGALFAHIRKIEAPILQEHEGVLHLWFAAKGLAGAHWYQLAHRLSADTGKHWSRVQAISHQPLGLPNPPSGQPAKMLNQGEIAFPSSLNSPENQQAWLRINPNGRIVGRFWQPQPALPARFKTSPFALLELKNGQSILVGNPPSGQNTLAIWLQTGKDTGWKKMKNLESANDPQAHFGQPALALAPDGNIHLAYIWRDQGIRLRSFNFAWLTEDAQ